MVKQRKSKATAKKAEPGLQRSGARRSAAGAAKARGVGRAMRDLEDELSNAANTDFAALFADALKETNDLPGQRTGQSIEIKSAAVLGALVRAARRRMNLTQQEFADLAGVGRRFVSDLESGKPTLEFNKVMQACAAAGVDLSASERSAL